MLMNFNAHSWGQSEHVQYELFWLQIANALDFYMWMGFKYEGKVLYQLIKQ